MATPLASVVAHAGWLAPPQTAPPFRLKLTDLPATGLPLAVSVASRDSVPPYVPLASATVRLVTAFCLPTAKTVPVSCSRVGEL